MDEDEKHLTAEEAEKAAQARSEYFNTVKADMLRQAMDQQRQKLMLQMMQGGQ